MKKKRDNRFEKLRKPGVRGRVVARDFKSMNLIDTLKSHAVVYTGELLPGVWDYGFRVYREGDSRIQGYDIKRLPGEGSGWFKTEHDARLYALDEMLILFQTLGLDTYFIESKLNQMLNPSLF